MRKPVAVADVESAAEEKSGKQSSDRVDELCDLIQDALGCLNELGVRSAGTGRPGRADGSPPRQVDQLLALA